MTHQTFMPPRRPRPHPTIFPHPPIRPPVHRVMICPRRVISPPPLPAVDSDMRTMGLPSFAVIHDGLFGVWSPTPPLMPFGSQRRSLWRVQVQKVVWSAGVVGMPILISPSPLTSPSATSAVRPEACPAHCICVRTSYSGGSDPSNNREGQCSGGQ
jgi:hypothetical protein